MVCARQTTDHDLESVIPDKKRKTVIFAISCGHVVFYVIKRCKNFLWLFYSRNGFGEFIYEFGLWLFVKRRYCVQVGRHGLPMRVQFVSNPEGLRGDNVRRGPLLEVLVTTLFGSPGSGSKLIRILDRHQQECWMVRNGPLPRSHRAEELRH